MNIRLKCESERVSPTGNIAPLGILNQLGRPTLDPLAVLIREAAQNSWDARLSEVVPVWFNLDSWVLTTVQRRVLSNHIFADTPPPATLPLTSCLHASSDISVLAISDRGTTGMAGPTRADIVTQAGEPRNFVDFLRDVGQPQQRQFAGGTYGYGKAAYYRVSSVKTICVYTRCMTPNGRESRFTAAALGESFSQNNSRYTGRHWWGEQRNGIVEPSLNAEADNLAATLGLTVFPNDETGTTIVIVQPQFFQPTQGEETLTQRQVCLKMVEYILLYCWPKMLSHGANPPSMRFGVSWQSEELQIPNPTHFPPLQGFVQAMRRMKEPNEPDTPCSSLRHLVKNIASQKPAKHLGVLTLQQSLILPANPMQSSSHNNSPFAQLTHHTALMRQPELIVNYVAGPAPASPYVGYAGVFLVDAAVDNIFAASEPPTHDAWIHTELEGRSERIYVNVALKAVGREMAIFAHPPQATTVTTPLTPLGAFASMIGDSLAPALTGSTARLGVSSYQPNPDLNPPLSNNIMDELATINSNSDQHKLNNVDGNEKNSPVIKRIDTENIQFSEVSTQIASPAPRNRRAYVRTLSDGDFVIIDGIPALQIPFTVTHAIPSQGTIVHAVISTILDGGQIEKDPPIGASQAAVLYWVAPNGNTYKGGFIFIPFSLQSNWHVVISIHNDMMLSIELRAAARI